MKNNFTFYITFSIFFIVLTISNVNLYFGKPTLLHDYAWLVYLQLFVFLAAILSFAFAAGKEWRLKHKGRIRLGEYLSKLNNYEREQIHKFNAFQTPEKITTVQAVLHWCRVFAKQSSSSDYEFTEISDKDIDSMTNYAIGSWRTMRDECSIREMELMASAYKKALRNIRTEYHLIKKQS